MRSDGGPRTPGPLWPAPGEAPCPVRGIVGGLEVGCHRPLDHKGQHAVMIRRYWSEPRPPLPVRVRARWRSLFS